jgi:hypothetical protein
VILEHEKARNYGRTASGPEQAEAPHQWHAEVPTTNYNLDASFCVDMHDKTGGRVMVWSLGGGPTSALPRRRQRPAPPIKEKG